jgi:hypothetical protein
MKFRPPNRGRRALPVTLGAPTGGLNGRDSLTSMPDKDAYVLDNWFPNSTSVDTRNGSSDFATGIGATVESLEVYTGAAGAKLLAFGNGKIFDASAVGAVGAALISSRTSDKATSAMFSNAGTQFLLIYTGSDQPLSYDGTNLTALTYTAMTGSQNAFFAALAFKGRLLIAQTGMLGFYYAAVGAIQGAVSYFDLSQQSLKGGSLAAIASYSQESMGSGPQDYAVFATTEGEYIMYTGSDPSSATAWGMVGRYVGPAPIGKKCWFKFRSDLYFITAEGILSFSQIRAMGEEHSDTEYTTSRLGRIYTDATTYQTTHGWTGLIYPRGNALVVNVPLGLTEADGYQQFVMNTTTNRWGRYTGWNGVCFTVFNKRLYFGTVTGKVVLADEGSTDNGTEIQAICRQAWNTFDDGEGMGNADKQFHMAEFAVQADGLPAISANINVNYQDDPPGSAAAVAPPAGATWDVATWDVDDWAGAASTQTVSVSVGKIGYTSSIWMQAVSKAAQIRWFATRIILEKTQGVLLQ